MSITIVWHAWLRLEHRACRYSSIIVGVATVSAEVVHAYTCMLKIHLCVMYANRYMMMSCWKYHIMLGLACRRLLRPPWSRRCPSMGSACRLM